MKYFKILLLIIIVISNYSTAQISSRKIDKLVNEAMETFNVAGVAVGIVRDGKIIHNKGYGVKSIETNEPVNEHTNFAIASNTKAFTTVALSILVDEGKLSWDDKVVDHIPEFKMYNEYVTQNFTITDLVTHRSGLGKGAGDLMWWPTGTDFTIENVLSCFQYFEPTSAFRTKHRYNNILYIVAGEVVARISGMSYEDFIKTHIFVSLDMERSFISFSKTTVNVNIATPHAEKEGILETIPQFEGKIANSAAEIYSNVDDLCNWMLVHLNRGKYGEDLEKQLFSEDNHKKMWRIHTVFDPDTSTRYNSHFNTGGMGWYMEDKKGNLVVSHGGSLPGMRSLPVLIPDLDLGIFVLTNAETGGYLHRSVTKTIIDKYLKLAKYNWIDYYYKRLQKYEAKGDSVTSLVWKTVESANEDNINIDDYLGIFEDNWFGKAEVFLNDNQLWFKFYRSPKLNGPMYYYNANVFVINWEYQVMNPDAFAIFSLDEEGKAQSIKMKGISPNIDFSYDFQDLEFVRIKEE